MGRKKKNETVVEVETIDNTIAEQNVDVSSEKYQIIGNFKELGFIGEVFDKNSKYVQLIQNKLLIMKDCKYYDKFIKEMLDYNIIKKI